jgi:A/G-specific adenine glycosylase
VRKEDEHAEIVQRLGAWFDVEKRDMSWRRTKDPYAIWLSEVMLQQTRVKTVEDYFPRFLQAYPTVSHLARADLADVLGAWSGLGYYRRARALYAGAREVVEKYGGKLPGDAATLRTISGIGPYTAGAISSIAFGAREALVDGNVARVLARLFALRCDVRSPKGSREVWALATELVPAERAGRHNESLMELGATICVPVSPRCDACPVKTLCEAQKLGIEKDLPVAKKKKPPRELEDVTHLGEQTHVLTHRKLRIQITTARIKSDPALAKGAPYECLAWKGAAELESLAMSSLARKVLLACPG